MRRYDMHHPTYDARAKDVSVFELSHYLDMYGFTAEEFEQVIELQPGQAISLHGCEITRVDPS